jgi:hypothetical protein
MELLALRLRLAGEAPGKPVFIGPLTFKDKEVVGVLN